MRGLLGGSFSGRIGTVFRFLVCQLNSVAFSIGYLCVDVVTGFPYSELKSLENSSNNANVFVSYSHAQRGCSFNVLISVDSTSWTGEGSSWSFAKLGIRVDQALNPNRRINQNTETLWEIGPSRRRASRRSRHRFRRIQRLARLIVKVKPIEHHGTSHLQRVVGEIGGIGVAPACIPSIFRSSFALPTPHK